MAAEPTLSARVVELRALVAVMRELDITEAYGIKLGVVPAVAVPLSPAEQPDREDLENARIERKLRLLTGGKPSPELAEKLRRIVK
jgi:hypothetical protein